MRWRSVTPGRRSTALLCPAVSTRRLGAALGVAIMVLATAACGGDDSGSTISDIAGATTATSTALGSDTTVDSDTTPGGETTAPQSTQGADDTSTVSDSTGAPGSDTSVVLDTVDTTPVPDDTEPPAQVSLPGDGPATVGGIDLPAGKVLLGNDQRLAWITDEAVPGAAAVWKALYDVRAQTGLYPVLLYDDGEPAGWELDRFFPNQPNELDNLALTEVYTNAAELYLDTPRTFNGLAPASSGPEDAAAADALVATLADTRILLVESPRGADALSSMGWTGNATYDSTEAIAVAIRSWEDRFGARVVAVGPSSVVMSVARPPATSAESAPLSEELVLIDPDLETPGPPVNVVQLGDALIAQHLWTLWWA